MTPGLIDNHMHLLRAGITWQQEVRWDGVGSRKQALDMLRARGRAVSPGAWVFNLGGWAIEQFADDRKPFTRDELDQIVPNNPVVPPGLLPRGLPQQPRPAGVRDRRARVRLTPWVGHETRPAGRPAGFSRPDSAQMVNKIPELLGTPSPRRARRR